MKRTKQILFFVSINRCIITFIIVLFSTPTLAKSCTVVLIDSVANSLPINKSAILSQIIFTTPDVILYNAENMHIYTGKTETKTTKNKKYHKRKIYNNKNIVKTCKKFAKKNMQNFKKPFNNHYYSLSKSYNLAIINFFKYVTRAYVNTKARLINQFKTKKLLLICYEKQFSFSDFIFFNMVRPPPHKLCHF